MEQQRLKRIVKRGLEKKKKKLAKTASASQQSNGSAITASHGADSDHNTSGKTEIHDIEPATSNMALVSSGILSDATFSSLEGRVSDLTLRGISEMGLTQMTKIQAEAIPHLLEGRDMVASAQTGSGKTLAYMIPGVETLHRLAFTPRNGAGMIVIVPTRELSIQTYSVARELCKHHALTLSMVMGGASRSDEAAKLARGASIVIGTPGRLLDHLRDTPAFIYKNLQVLVIDEADRLLETGFEEELKQIIALLPKRRQTVLLSATLNAKTADLTRLAVQKKPVEIRVEAPRECATAAGLEQGYVVCDSDRRFLLLFTFLRKNAARKNMVFFSACSTVQFYADLLNYVDLPVMAIHGRQKQSKRTATFMRFCAAQSGTLLCTDVAARGLDIPRVDWIVQYDPPDDPREYVHRVGRTARGEGARGNALLYLLAEEVGFLRYLRDAKVHLQEYEFSWNKVADIQNQLEKLIERNYFLHQSGRDAFKAYIRAYASHSLKQIFDVNRLDLTKVAKSFGFSVPPFVDLNVYSARADKKTKKRKMEETSESAPLRKKMVYKPLAKR